MKVLSDSPVSVATPKKGEKSKYFTFLTYPESLPDNWQEQIRLSGLSIVVSPLHDSDIKADGEKVKPHYHNILMLPNTTTLNAADNATSFLCGTRCQCVLDLGGLFRYYDHSEYSEKVQYDKADIQYFGESYGRLERYADNSKTPTKSELQISRENILALITAYKISTLRDLYIYASRELTDDENALEQIYFHPYFFAQCLYRRKENDNND